MRPSLKPSPLTNYSTYEDEGGDATESDKKRVIILGGGPNRIGQGIEFDYCCCMQLRASRDGDRIDHGEQQSRDGKHRLRYERSPLYLTVDDRGTY